MEPEDNVLPQRPLKRMVRKTLAIIADASLGAIAVMFMEKCP